MTRSCPRSLVLFLVVLLVPSARAGAPDAAQLEAMTARYAPVDIVVPLEGLPASERTALQKMVAASRILNGIFLGQVAPGNAARLVTLAAEARAGRLLSGRCDPGRARGLVRDARCDRPRGGDGILYDDPSRWPGPPDRGAV